MSLLNNVLKLAQSLDEKGLKSEADVLDKFASYIADGDDEAMQVSRLMTKDEVSQHERLMDVPWMSPEIQKETFNAFKSHFESEGFDSISAVRQALSEMNRMMRDLQEPMSDKEEAKHRENAKTMTLDFAGLSED